MNKAAASLIVHIERLFLEECAAVRERDWATARNKAEERAALQESQHLLAAGRWSKNSQQKRKAGVGSAGEEAKSTKEDRPEESIRVR